MLPDGFQSRPLAARDHGFVMRTWLHRYWKRFRTGLEGWPDALRAKCEAATRDKDMKLLEAIYNAEWPIRVRHSLEINRTVVVAQDDAPEFVIAWVSFMPSGLLEMCHAIFELRRDIEPLLADL